MINPGIVLFLSNELLFVALLGFSTEFCNKQIEECIQKYSIIILDNSSGYSNKENHQLVLKLYHLKIKFSAFGCFEINLKVMEMVRKKIVI